RRRTFAERRPRRLDLDLRLRMTQRQETREDRPVSLGRVREDLLGVAEPGPEAEAADSGSLDHLEEVHAGDLAGAPGRRHEAHADPAVLPGLHRLEYDPAPWLGAGASEPEPVEAHRLDPLLQHGVERVAELEVAAEGRGVVHECADAGL